MMSHVANIDKAVREKLPSSHLIDLLKSLKTGVVATEKLLRVSLPAAPLPPPPLPPPLPLSAPSDWSLL